MESKIKEILELANFYGFDIESKYCDGEKITEKAITLEELERILIEVLSDE